MSLIRYTVIFILIGTWSFFFGFKMAQDRGLEQCKKAGWAFIDETFHFDREKDRKTYTPQALKEVRYLQSKISTKCIVRFE